MEPNRTREAAVTAATISGASLSRIMPDVDCMSMKRIIPDISKAADLFRSVIPDGMATALQKQAKGGQT